MWEGGCVIDLTQHNCLIWKLPGKSWLVLMNSCIWFRDEISVHNKRKKKKSTETMKEQKISGQEICYCQYSCRSPILCFQGTPFCSGCMGSGIDAVLMTSREVVSTPAPSMGNTLLVRAFHKWQVLGTKYKKMLENTPKGHVIQSDLCTVSALQVTLTTTSMFLPWHYSSTELDGFTKRMNCSPLWQTWNSVKESNFVQSPERSLVEPQIPLMSLGTQPQKRRTGFCVSSCLLGKGPLWWQLLHCRRLNLLEQYWGKKFISDS